MSTAVAATCPPGRRFTLHVQSRSSGRDRGPRPITRDDNSQSQIFCQPRSTSPSRYGIPCPCGRIGCGGLHGLHPHIATATALGVFPPVIGFLGISPKPTCPKADCAFASGAPVSETLALYAFRRSSQAVTAGEVDGATPSHRVQLPRLIYLTGPVEFSPRYSDSSPKTIHGATPRTSRGTDLYGRGHAPEGEPAPCRTSRQM